MAKKRVRASDMSYSDWKGTTGPGALLRSLGLNPDFNPNWAKIIEKVRGAIDANEPYASREERAAAYAKFYDEFKKDYE